LALRFSQGALPADLIDGYDFDDFVTFNQHSDYDIHDRQDDYWHQVDQVVARKSGTGYNEAVRLLIELREVADQFKETQKFQARFRTWVQPHMRRPALLERLHKNKFALPQV
jgi:hypothetical protein